MFPRSLPHSTGSLDMPDGQSVYWEESGTNHGIPALYLHGGPGGTLASGAYTARFAPARFRIVGFDQRGCGRSAPLADEPAHELDRNTTAHLIADMEALREDRGIDQWVLHGASWGSTLALAYAQTHPDRVLGMVLMAVTTTSRSEVDWITEGVGALFPEAWDRFAGVAERAGTGYRRGRDRIVEAYAELVRDPDPAVRQASAQAWAEWEDAHAATGPGDFHRDPRWDDPRFTEVFVTLTTHYWSHDGFWHPPVLDRMDRLQGIPATLIHGRLDASSPVATAWRLHQSWPGSDLIIDEGDGHGGASLVESATQANTRLADRLAAKPTGR